MKKLLFFSAAITLNLLFSCGNGSKKDEGKIMLSFHPVPGQQIKMNYSFSVI